MAAATSTRPASFDVADFPVPTGREEEWRFTPLKRLRGPARRRRVRRRDLEARATSSRGRHRSRRRPRRRPRLGSGLAPGRPGRRPACWPPPTQAVAGRRARARPCSTEPVVVDLHGDVGDDRVYGHLVDRGRRVRRGDRGARPHRVARRSPTNVEFVVGDGAKLTVVSRRRTGTTTPCTWPSTHALVGRDATFKHVAVTFGGDLVRHAHQRRVRRPRRRRPSCSASTSPTPASTMEHRLFVDHDAPAQQEQRGLQGRAAGRGRAHGLDRRRADPQGRRGHRHLRGEPQPGPHRRLPGRLGAQPGDRDRRDRGRRPRLARPAASTTSSCSTCCRAASPRTRPGAWSCAASSPS